MKRMLSYGLVGLSLLGITVGAVIPTTATESKTEIATAICDNANTQDILSTLNKSDIQSLLEQYDCSVEDLENIAAQCVGNTKSERTTESDCTNNSLLESLKDKLSQSKNTCNSKDKSKNNVSDSKTTVTENTDKNCTTDSKTTVTESQDKNSVSDYVQKAKELIENKSNVKAEDVKEFCNSVNNSSNKKTICSVLDSEELKNLLKKFGCSFDNNQNTTNPPSANTKPTKPSDKEDSDTGNNSNGNSGNNSGNNSNNNTGNQNQNTTPTENKNVSSVSEYEKRVVELVNQIRAENGLSKLTLNTKLSSVARLKSQDMKDKKYFSHTSPTYGSPFDMMKQFGISYRTAGENIAYGYSTPEAVVEGWMNSPGHRANILNSSYKEIGVGYVASGHYWTQMFIG